MNATLSPSKEPAYTRLDVDERRRRLLALGTDLFTRHAYDELSMARIAREAGISKALLYHYFPSKRDFFVATLQDKAAEVAGRIDPEAEPVAQLDAFLTWIDENAVAYSKLLRSAGIAEVGELINAIRSATADRIVAGLGHDEPAVRVAVRGWLAFLDGLVLEWLERREIDRDAVRDIALGGLLGALAATGVQAP